MNTSTNPYIGLDISKEAIDLCDYPTTITTRYANDSKGIRTLTGRLCKLQPRLIVLEATGGYQNTLVNELHKHQLTVAVINPRRARDFARALGILAKTDQVGARVLARYAATIQPAPCRAKRPVVTKLEALTTRYRQITEMITAERNRLQHNDSVIAREIQQMIRTLERHRAKVQNEMDELIERD